FLEPEYERRGIGQRLQRLMLDWYFTQTKETVWLSTAPQSRAAAFYKKAGWVETGTYGKGELKFEMTINDWQQHSISQ
ncbi:MAG: GNAT family N-acetyltransferase, partial [Chryseobacterium sp.]